MCGVKSSHVEKLKKVAEAARDEAMFWNEELCKWSEYEQKEAAIQRLETALKELDDATGGE
jgi:nucleoside 2-deoxyribosyltransferase